MTIYDFDNNTITVQNNSDLTLYEKQAILACFTADVTFNSFAAEVEYHAEAALIIPEFLHDKYLKAIRADMAVGEENEDYITSPYFYLDSPIVVSQSQVHGEY